MDFLCKVFAFCILYCLITVHGSYFITCLFFFFSLRDSAPTHSNFCLSIYYVYFHFVSYILFLTFTLCDFCVLIKRGFLNVSSFQADMDCFCLNTFCSDLTFLYWFVFFILTCIYRIFLNFKHMTWPNIVQIYQFYSVSIF